MKDPHSGFSIAVDSNVTLSSVAKGRSSSHGLRPILRRIAALQIGGSLYPSLHFSPTRLNPSDPPSRGRPLDEPGDRGFHFESFEELLDLCELPPMKRFAANWCRLLIKVLGGRLSWFGCGDSWRFQNWRARAYPIRYQVKGSHATEAYIKAHYEGPSSCQIPIVCSKGFDHLDFDKTLGFPGEGPVWISWILWNFCLVDFWTSSQPASLDFHEVGSWTCSPCFLAPCWLIKDKTPFFGMIGWFGGGLGFAHAMEVPAPLMPRDSADRKRAALRGHLHLQQGRPVTAKTQHQRDKLLAEFGIWLSSRSIDLQEVVAPEGMDVERVNHLLELYGRDMFAAGRPYGHYSETINAVTSKRPKMKRMVQQAWDLAYTWLREEPPVHHIAIPWQVVVALLSTALMWNWVNEAGIVALSFGAVTRIGEALMASREDLILPRDLNFTVDYALLTIKEAKTRFRSARHQAAKLDQPQLLKILDLAFFNMRKDQRLWPYSPQTMRNRFQRLLKGLRLQGPLPGIGRSIDLGSLRAAGASWLLMVSEDAELTRRRGRWITTKVMEIYVQETMALQFLQKVPEETRNVVLLGAAVFPELLEKVFSFWKNGVPQVAWNVLLGAQASRMDRVGKWRDVESGLKPAMYKPHALQVEKKHHESLRLNDD